MNKEVAARVVETMLKVGHAITESLGDVKANWVEISYVDVFSQLYQQLSVKST